MGRGHARHIGVQPGGSFTWRLAPGAFTSIQPGDPLSHFPGTRIRTTLPMTVTIVQGSEPHVFRVDARLALAAAIGDSTDCALVSSALTARTYYPGGQPPS